MSSQNFVQAETSPHRCPNPYPPFLISPKIEKLDDVAETLEELWISYNQVTTLDGLSNLSHLTRLYMSNNSVKSWAELDKLVSGTAEAYHIPPCVMLGVGLAVLFVVYHG